MAFKSLVSPDELKWGFIVEATKPKQPAMWVRYNDRADICMILFVPPERETDVFYVDGNVGLLVETETRNVVGFQIEAFKRSFLPHHAEVDQIWYLRDTDAQPPVEFSDFSLRFREVEREVARAVIRATEDLMDEPALEEMVAQLA